jgi:hypothetical protein
MHVCEFVCGVIGYWLQSTCSSILSYMATVLFHQAGITFAFSLFTPTSYAQTHTQSMLTSSVAVANNPVYAYIGACLDISSPIRESVYEQLQLLAHGLFPARSGTRVSAHKHGHPHTGTHTSAYDPLFQANTQAITQVSTHAPTQASTSMIVRSHTHTELMAYYLYSGLCACVCADGDEDVLDVITKCVRLHCANTNNNDMDRSGCVDTHMDCVMDLISTANLVWTHTQTGAEGENHMNINVAASQLLLAVMMSTRTHTGTSTNAQTHSGRNHAGLIFTVFVMRVCECVRTHWNETLSFMVRHQYAQKQQLVASTQGNKERTDTHVVDADTLTYNQYVKGLQTHMDVLSNTNNSSNNNCTNTELPDTISLSVCIALFQYLVQGKSVCEWMPTSQVLKELLPTHMAQATTSQTNTHPTNPHHQLEREILEHILLLCGYEPTTRVYNHHSYIAYTPVPHTRRAKHHSHIYRMNEAVLEKLSRMQRETTTAMSEQTVLEILQFIVKSSMRDQWQQLANTNARAQEMSTQGKDNEASHSKPSTATAADATMKTVTSSAHAATPPTSAKPASTSTTMTTAAAAATPRTPTTLAMHSTHTTHPANSRTGTPNTRMITTPLQVHERLASANASGNSVLKQLAHECVYNSLSEQQLREQTQTMSLFEYQQFLKIKQTMFEEKSKTETEAALKQQKLAAAAAVAAASSKQNNKEVSMDKKVETASATAQINEEDRGEEDVDMMLWLPETDIRRFSKEDLSSNTVNMNVCSNSFFLLLLQHHMEQSRTMTFVLGINKLYRKLQLSRGPDQNEIILLEQFAEFVNILAHKPVALHEIAEIYAMSVGAFDDKAAVDSRGATTGWQKLYVQMMLESNQHGNTERETISSGSYMTFREFAFAVVHLIVLDYVDCHKLFS